jgi:CubicO group peptidase (beta-lactamase class C family)
MRVRAFTLCISFCLVFAVPNGASATADSRIDISAIRRDLNTIVPAEMERRHFPGVVVVVVDRGGTVLAQGYGLADLGSRVPVVPEYTTFRVASVSKLFTATAVMQLVERGRIDLDQDVGTYIKSFRIHKKFPQPITTRHLLTHTAGFSERFFGSRSRTKAAQIPLGEYLAGNLPAQFIAPGQICSYSNHGVALAGFVVESVSGLPFQEYVSQEILRPLGMIRSSFGMEPSVLTGLAQGYVFSSGSYQRIPVDFRNEVPSGSLITTGVDMACFLRAFLNGGEVDGTRVLGRATTAAMLKRQFSPHPHMRGVGVGFWEFGDNGRIWGHDGDIVGWNACAALAPERGLGLFVAYTGTDTSKAFADRVMNIVFEESPASNQRKQLPRAERAATSRVEGLYRWTRTVRKTPDRLFVPYWLVQYRARFGPAGALELTNPIGLFQPSEWEPVGPLLFREVRGNRLLSLRESTGEVTHLFLEGPISMAFERISWWESVAVQAALFLFFIVAFLVVGASGMIGHRRSEQRTLMAVAAVADIAFLFAFPPAMGLHMFFSDLLPLPPVIVPPGNPPFFYGMPLPAMLLLALPLIAFGVTGILIIRTLFGRVPTRRSFRVALEVASFAALQSAFAWLLQYWNLLDYTR